MRTSDEINDLTNELLVLMRKVLKNCFDHECAPHFLSEDDRLAMIGLNKIDKNFIRRVWRTVEFTDSDLRKMRLMAGPYGKTFFKLFCIQAESFDGSQIEHDKR